MQENLENMMQRDKDNFRRICNKMLNQTFICKQPMKDDYMFVIKHKNLFIEYMAIMGYRIDINEEYGVVHLVNEYNSNRYNLKLYETIILLILRILYAEKKRELSLSDSVIINVGEIQDKFTALKIRDKQLDKTVMRDAISTMRRFNIAEPLDKNLTNEDSRLIIRESILMAVRTADIRDVCEKIDDYKKGESEI